VKASKGKTRRASKVTKKTQADVTIPPPQQRESGDRVAVMMAACERTLSMQSLIGQNAVVEAGAMIVRALLDLEAYEAAYSRKGEAADKADLRRLSVDSFLLGYKLGSALAQFNRVKGSRDGVGKKSLLKDERHRRAIAAFDATDPTLNKTERIRLACAATGICRSTLYTALKSRR
jgi:hypothetical protein